MSSSSEVGRLKKTDVSVGIRRPYLCPSKGHQHGISIQSLIDLSKKFFEISWLWIISQTWFLARLFVYSSSFISWTFRTDWLAFIFLMAWQWKLRIGLGLVSGSLRYAHIEIMPWLPMVLKGHLLTNTKAKQTQNRLTVLYQSTYKHTFDWFQWSPSYTDNQNSPSYWRIQYCCRYKVLKGSGTHPNLQRKKICNWL